MPTIWASKALLANEWADDVSIRIDGDGVITAIEVGTSPGGQRAGILLPAPANAHSHAFQRAMAGLTEGRGPDAKDSFWTWRRLMYRFLDRLTPDHVEAIVAFVQMEMLEAGYGANVEFHYLHHQPNGTLYANVAEMAERIAAATAESGIGLTLLPVHYQYGGCDKRPLGDGQVRFGNDIDRFAWLLSASRAALKPLAKDCTIGVAAHSLRAVAADDLPTLARLAGDRPFHMHLAEQQAEVDEVKEKLGRRPVEWVLENIEPDDRCCFIHCTRMQPHETTGLAKTGAMAGLCPITEANLGDGIFDGCRWLEAGGNIAIGSDSNIRISLTEELRTLEYSQRLRDRARAALATSERSTGRRLFEAVNHGGAKAAGRDSGVIAVGKLADLVALDDQRVDLMGRRGDVLLDSFIFAGDDRLITDVWSAGRHMVQGGRHVRHDKITARFGEVMAELGAAM